MTTAELVEPASAFADIAPVFRSYAVASLGRAAYTLFLTPEHEKLHAEMEDMCLDGPCQPVQPPIDEVTKRIAEDVLPKYDIDRPVPTDSGRLIHLAGALIQFGDYIPKMHGTINAQYGQVKELHEEVVNRAAETQPLDFADQLDVALEQGDGNLTESMWRLFMTSRLHARWLDSKIVGDIPEMTKEDKLAEMLAWRGAIAACKEPDPSRAQDPNGDNYYAWTHGLAKVAFSLAPRKETSVTRASVRTFEQGTHLMHKLVHTFNKQGVASNHDVAAEYGNAMGQAIVDTVKIAA